MAASITMAQGHFEGYMCDFAVWSERLTADEITKIYNDGYRYNLKDPNRPAGLVSWWPMGSDPQDSLGAPITVDGVLYSPAGAVFDELNRAPLVPPAVGSNPTASAEGVAPRASLPLFDFLKNTVPKVSEISAYTTPGLGSPSGAFVPGIYPFQGRPSGTYGAPNQGTVLSPNQNYEPPYSTLVESASISFTGMAYNDYAIRYANLDTHVLESPNFQPNTKSIQMTGAAYGGWVGSANVSTGPGAPFKCGNNDDWATYQAPKGLSASAGPNSAWSIATWFKVTYSGSFTQANPTQSTPEATLVYNPGQTAGSLFAYAGGKVYMTLWSFLPTLGNAYLNGATNNNGTLTPTQGLRLIARWDPGTNGSSSAPTWMPWLNISGGYTVGDAGASNNPNAASTHGALGNMANFSNGNLYVTGSDWDWDTGAGGVIEKDRWYHIVCTYDGQILSARVRLSPSARIRQ